MCVCVRESFEGWKHSRIRKRGLPTDNYRGKRVWLRVVTTLTLGKYDAEPKIQPGLPAAPFPLTHRNAQSNAVKIYNNTLIIDACSPTLDAFWCLHDLDPQLATQCFCSQ